MTHQELAARGQRISELNHQIEDAKLETLATQAELFREAVLWAKDAGMSAMDLRSSLKRMREGIEKAEADLIQAGLVHSTIQARYDEVMDLPFGDCPRAELEQEPVSRLKVAS